MRPNPQTTTPDHATDHPGAAMKAGWKTKTVSEVAKHSLGKMLDKAKNKGTPHDYLRNVNVRWFNFDLSDIRQMRFLDDESSRFTAMKGDVLICEGGYPGRAAIWDEDYPIHFQKAIHRVRFHESERNKWFVYHLYFLDLSGELRQYFTGTGIQHFTGETRARLPIPLPPLPEQRRIVGILDEAFDGLATAKANAEKNLQNARALFESHLNAVFTQRGEGWDTQSLVSLCSLFFDSAHRTPKYQDEGIPALRPRDVVNRKLDLTGARRVSAAEYKIQSKRHKPNAGDIVYSRELSYGWAAMLPESPHVCLSQGMCVFRPNDDLDGNYLLYVLNGPLGRDQAHRAAVGASHPHINLGGIKSYRIPFPPLKVQRRITKEFDVLAAETQRLASIYQRKLAALDELKKSLLDQAFSGQL
ncbi:MAG: restriction endonuclease subunit S [Planctomycetota bacterium]|nr:restriction endonuclease subunit S [Planctomycetota bacterium]